MAVYDELWFWMLIVGLIALGIGIYLYEIDKKAGVSTPGWGYVLFILAIVLLIAALIVGLTTYYHVPEGKELMMEEEFI